MKNKTSETTLAAGLYRWHLRVHGAVQGLGFRPYLYRLASSLGLTGWVQNTPDGVELEVQGPEPSLQLFRRSLEEHPPPLARLHQISVEERPPEPETEFVIRHSRSGHSPRALILPDLATCPECLEELFDPSNRRFRYPFINCTLCGPRFSIIENLPYDRANTTMKHFKMCPECAQEYEDPANRRFHAQPNACPRCGPHLELWDAAGKVLQREDAALEAAADCLRQGKILALKGIGGFQLLVDARNTEAVRRLRRRKHREEKPFALMYPDLEAVRADCFLNEAEQTLLLSVQAPIVLLRRRPDARHFPDAETCALAPRNPRLGVMLPYSPLHHLLMKELGFPVVATSGNLSEEPICIDEHEALQRLGNIADLFLVHNRPIQRHVDDSVAAIVNGRLLLLRRARGYAPFPVTSSLKAPQPVAATGAHLKNTVGVARDNEFFLGQHIGDLATEAALQAHQRVLHDLCRVYELDPARVACDLHPDYLSTHTAQNLGRPLVRVQHHHAHVAAVLGEYGLEGPVLGVAWDGVGYGPDGTVWGGEFLVADTVGFRRFAWLRPFPLPGGEAATREPRRSAFGALYAMGRLNSSGSDKELPAFGDITPYEQKAWLQILATGANAPLCSSAGRLFDAVASLIGLRQRCSYEGQAAMELEYQVPLADSPAPEARDRYAFVLKQTPAGIEVDWQPVLDSVVRDWRAGVDTRIIAAAFHAALVEMIVQVALRAELPDVVLCGGCFQNLILLQWGVSRLRQNGFRVWVPSEIPPNDGGIAFGQLVVAAAQAGVNEEGTGR